MARLSEYKQEYCDILMDCMSNGMLDCEIYKKLQICKNTFLRWRKEYPEFDEAYQIGLPQCEAWWTERMREKWQAGEDKGFKYCALLMNTKFGYRENQATGVTNNTQINIQGNMNVIDSKSTDELREAIASNLTFLQDNKVIDTQLIEVAPKDD